MEEKDNNSFPTMLQKDLKTIKVIVPKVVCRKPTSVLHLLIATQIAYKANTLHFDNLLIEESRIPSSFKNINYSLMLCASLNNRCLEDSYLTETLFLTSPNPYIRKLRISMYSNARIL